MTQIDFFSNAPNRLDYVVRLLKKVRAAEQTAVVLAAPDALNSLSDALWRLDGFYAHDVSPDEFIAPIALLDHMPTHLPHYVNLINLTDSVPDGFASFTRLIEVVPTNDATRQAARERWSFYKDRGYAMTHHDISAK